MNLAPYAILKPRHSLILWFCMTGVKLKWGPPRMGSTSKWGCMSPFSWSSGDPRSPFSSWKWGRPSEMGTPCIIYYDYYCCQSCIYNGFCIIKIMLFTIMPSANSQYIAISGYCLSMIQQEWVCIYNGTFLHRSHSWSSSLIFFRHSAHAEYRHHLTSPCH